jgi:hypothetical protein
MLGSVYQDIIQELSPDLWSIMMFYIAKCMRFYERVLIYRRNNIVYGICHIGRASWFDLVIVQNE